MLESKRIEGKGEEGRRATCDVRRASSLGVRRVDQLLF